jgi:hypothetical protein
MLHSKRRTKTEPASGQLARSRTKQETILGMLRRPQGATIAAIVKATGWQQHSVRGFFAGVVRKRLKLKLGSNRVDGNRIYQITSAEAGGPSSHPSRRRSA